MHSADPATSIETSGRREKVPQAAGVTRASSTWVGYGASLIIAIFLALSGAQAAPDVTPLTKIKATLGAALGVLHNQQLPVDQRRRALLQLAERNLDLESMARGALGSHRNELTPAQRDEFVALFGAFIEAAYLTQIQEYVDLNIEVGEEKGTSAGYSMVDATVTQPHEDPLPITFMLERRGDDWLVYDVTAEGVSMVENYRAQFDRVIKRDGLAQLLTDLRAKQKGLMELIGKP